MSNIRKKDFFNRRNFNGQSVVIDGKPVSILNKQENKIEKKTDKKKRETNFWTDSYGRNISLDRKYFYTRHFFNGSDGQNYLGAFITKEEQRIFPDDSATINNLVNSLQNQGDGLVMTIPENDGKDMSFNFFYFLKDDDPSFKYNFKVKMYTSNNYNHEPVKCTYIHLDEKNNFLYYNNKLFRLDEETRYNPISRFERDKLKNKYGIKENEIVDITNYDDSNAGKMLYNKDLSIHLNLLSSAGIFIEEPKIIRHTKKAGIDNPYNEQPIEQPIVSHPSDNIIYYNGFRNGTDTSPINKHMNNMIRKKNNHSKFRFYL